MNKTHSKNLLIMKIGWGCQYSNTPNAPNPTLRSCGRKDLVGVFRMNYELELCFDDAEQIFDGEFDFILCLGNRAQDFKNSIFIFCLIGSDFGFVQ